MSSDNNDDSLVTFRSERKSAQLHEVNVDQVDKHIEDIIQIESHMGKDHRHKKISYSLVNPLNTSPTRDVNTDKKYADNVDDAVINKMKVSNDCEEDDEFGHVAETDFLATRKEDDELADYFQAACQAPHTSDATLSKMGKSLKHFDHSTLWETLDTKATEFTERNAKILKKIKNGAFNEMFERWNFYLEEDFNIVTYGYGSKYEVLDTFREKYLDPENYDVVVVHGFFPGTTLKDLLTDITEELLQCTSTFSSVNEYVAAIISHYGNDKDKDDNDNGDNDGDNDSADKSDDCNLPPIKLVLLVHNIDGVALRDTKTQIILSTLAEAKNIHIIASVDHVNATLLWDQKMLASFNWLWFDTTTFLPYRRETAYETSLFLQKSAQLLLSSIRHVMASLTPNAKEIFLILANYQLEHHNEPTFIGMAFSQLYQRCREKFLVNSDLTLRTQLTEFRDHKLVKSKSGHDGSEYLVLPIDLETLKEFLESMKEDENDQEGKDDDDEDEEDPDDDDY